MSDQQRDHQALQQYFGLPLEVGRLEFRLIHARDFETSSGHPDGQAGDICKTDNCFEIDFPGKCRLRVEPSRSDGVIKSARVTIRSCEDIDPFIILIRIRLQTTNQPYFMIPGVLYGTNNACRGIMNTHQDSLGIGDASGYGGDPQLDYRGQIVATEKRLSPDWHFRADRSSAPMVYAHTDDYAIAIGINEVTATSPSDWRYNSLGLWTHPRQGDTVSVAIGSLDWPGRIVRHELHNSPTVEAIDQGAVDGSTELFISCRASHDLFAYEPILEQWHDHLQSTPRPGPPPKEAIVSVVQPLLEETIDPKSGYFCMFRDKNGFSSIGTLIAWAGVLQISEPLLRACKLIGHVPYFEKTHKMVERAIASSFNPESSMFFDVYEGQWQGNTWWPSLGHASVVSGHACWLILLMDRRGHANPEWIERVRRCLQQALKYQRADGRLPSGFACDNGQPTGFYGFGGCFFVAPMMMLGTLDDNQTMSNAALRALEHYQQEFSTLQWPGVDLDCRGAVDSGSCYSLIRALVEHHKQTQSPEIIKQLKHAFYYECSYRYAHNTRHRNGLCDWSSCGSRITSTHNAHIDAYGGLILDELAYLIDQTEHPYFQNRLNDAFAWARQAYNREPQEYGYGKQGWMVEQYYHTYDRYHHPEADGTVWEAYVPWCAGALLHSFLLEHERESDD